MMIHQDSGPIEVNSDWRDRPSPGNTNPLTNGLDSAMCPLGTAMMHCAKAHKRLCRL